MQEGRHRRLIEELCQLAQGYPHAASGSPACSDHKIRLSVAVGWGRGYQPEDSDSGSASSADPSTGSKSIIRLTGGMPQ